MHACCCCLLLEGRFRHDQVEALAAAVLHLEACYASAGPGAAQNIAMNNSAGYLKWKLTNGILMLHREADFCSA